MSNAIPPSVTPPSPHEWLETIKTITGITNARQAQITCASHGFTTEDQGVTTVMIMQVEGMLPINGLPGRIQEIVDSNNFTVDINTTQYPIYRGAGVISIVTGSPAKTQASFQYFNTPFHNIINDN